MAHRADGPAATRHAPRATSEGRNPAAWSERLPIVVEAGAGLAIAGYLALYQLGLTPHVWEPFFGDGSRRVLTSFVSRMLPVPDAVLGATGYLAELVTVLVGGQSRWRQTPWLVVLFGAAAFGMAAGAVVLVGLQLFVIQALCTLCLCSATLSVLAALSGADEVAATVRHLSRVARSGGSPWQALWGRAATGG